MFVEVEVAQIRIFEDTAPIIGALQGSQKYHSLPSVGKAASKLAEVGSAKLASHLLNAATG